MKNTSKFTGFTAIVSMNQKHFNRVFILMPLFLLLCGAAPVFSQNPRLGQPTLLQQQLNRLPAVPIPSVGSVNFQFGGDVWMAKLNGQSILAGAIEVHETNEGSILVLKQTHIYAKIAWIKTPGADIFLEFKNGPSASFSLISKSDMEAKLASAGVTAPPAGQAPTAGQVPIAGLAPSGGQAPTAGSAPPALNYDDEKDFTVELINEGSGARITRYAGKNTELRIPPRIDGQPVTEIGERAFVKKGLTNVAIPESVIFIGNLAFAENQIGSVSIGANVYIANNAFDGSGYNPSFVGFYNSQGRRAGIYSNSWRFVSAAAPQPAASVTQPTTAQQPAVNNSIISESAVVYAGNGHKYEIIDIGATWTKARDECKNKGGYLVTITSKEEQEFIVDLLSKNGKGDSYWLGGYRQGNTWKWVTGEAFTYTNWTGRTVGSEDLLMILRVQQSWSPTTRAGQWTYAKNDRRDGYICEWD
jgi:hypothetical protein